MSNPVKTNDEVDKVLTAWRTRLARIRGWNDTSLDDSWMEYLVAIAGFILKTGLTAETIESHVNEEIAKFERQASDEIKRRRLLARSPDTPAAKKT